MVGADLGRRSEQKIVGCHAVGADERAVEEEIDAIDRPIVGDSGGEDTRRTRWNHRSAARHG